MTNEQMIVNGIDVSGCEYCLKMIKYRCTIQQDVYKCLCEENPNCHYKQLAREKQECEYWQKELDKTHLLMLQKQDELVKAEKKLEMIRNVAKEFVYCPGVKLLEIIDEAEND